MSQPEPQATTVETTPEFNTAASKVKLLIKKPSSDELLTLYGLYKQATVGDNQTLAPGFFSGFEYRAKWNAWDSNRGCLCCTAQTKYIDTVNCLVTKYGVGEQPQPVPGP